MAPPYHTVKAKNIRRTYVIYEALLGPFRSSLETRDLDFETRDLDFETRDLVNSRSCCNYILIQFKLNIMNEYYNQLQSNISDSSQIKRISYLIIRVTCE